MGKVTKMFEKLHDLNTKFELIVCNLIECQRQNMEMIVNNKELNFYSKVDHIVALCVGKIVLGYWMVYLKIHFILLM